MSLRQQSLERLTPSLHGLFPARRSRVYQERRPASLRASACWSYCVGKASLGSASSPSGLEVGRGFGGEPRSQSDPGKDRDPTEDPKVVSGSHQAKCSSPDWTPKTSKLQRFERNRSVAPTGKDQAYSEESQASRHQREPGTTSWGDIVTALGRGNVTHA
jgi:hypothetical protein